MNSAANSFAMILLAAAGLPAQASPKLSAEEYQKQAAAALQRSDFPMAEFALRDFYRAYPENSGALVSLAYVLQRESRGAEAITLMQQARDRFDNVPDYHYQLGRLLMFGQSTEAIAEFERTAALADPKTTLAGAAHSSLATLYKGKGQMDDAMVEFRKARVTLGPTVLMGEALMTIGDLDGAIAELRAVLARDPKNVAVIGDLALALSDRPESLDEALLMAQREVALAPQQFFSFYALGRVQEKRREFEEAEAAFCAALQMEGGVKLAAVRQHLAAAMDARNVWSDERRELRGLLTAEQTTAAVARMMELVRQTGVK